MGGDVPNLKTSDRRDPSTIDVLVAHGFHPAADVNRLELPSGASGDWLMLKGIAPAGGLGTAAAIRSAKGLSDHNIITSELALALPSKPAVLASGQAGAPSAFPFGDAVPAYSVVVPCFSRQASVHLVLANLLAKTTAAEVVLAMQSSAVVSDAKGIRRRVQEQCDDKRHPCHISKLKMVDNVARNDEIFSASRFFVAAENATSPVLVHHDDDIIVDETMLRAMVSRVVAAFQPFHADAPHGPPTPSSDVPSGVLLSEAARLSSPAKIRKHDSNVVIMRSHTHS